MNKRTFVKNTALMTVTSLLLRTLGIVFRLILSGRLGAQGMGLYQLVFSVYVLGTAFASAGITTAVTRTVGERLAKGDAAGARRAVRLSAWLSLSVGLFSAAVLFFARSGIAALIGDARACPALAVCGAALPFVGVSACLKGHFLARRRAGPPCVAQLAEQITRIGAVLSLLTLAGDPPLGEACRIVMLGDVLSEGVSCALLLIFYFSDTRRLRHAAAPVPPLRRRTVLRQLLGIAVPLTAGRYLTTVLRTVENILVPARLTLFTRSDALSLAQFGAVKGMALPLLFFPAALLVTVTNLLVPELSDAHALGQRRQVARAGERAVDITVAAGIPIGCVFTVYGDVLGQLLYHDATVGLLLTLLGPLAPVMYLDTVATGLLRGLGEQVHSLWYAVADLIVRLVLIWLLLPRWGLSGFLFVMLVSNLLTAALSTHRLLTVSGARLCWRQKVFRPLFAALLCGGAVAALRRLLPAPVGTAAQILRLCLGSCVILSVCALVYFVIDRSPPVVYTSLKGSKKGEDRACGN